MKRNFGISVFAITALFLAANILTQGAKARPQSSATAAPTEDAVRETIKSKFDDVYFNGTAKTIYMVESVEYEFGPIRIGSVVKKQMGRGEQARDVYPVRVKVTVKQNRKDREPSVSERGVEGETFFFFKDGFDEWDFRTGR